MKRPFPLLCLTTLVVIGILTAAARSPLGAADDQDKAEIDKLKKQLKALEEKLQASQRESLELRQQAEAAAEAERQARLLGQKRLQQLQKAEDILSSVFRDLDPRGEDQGCIPLRAQLAARLDKAAELLDKAAISDDLAVARLRLALGHGLLSLGSTQRALVLVSQARQTLTAMLGPDHPETLTSVHELALAYRLAGKYDKALPLLEETLAALKARLGPEHPRTLAVVSDLGLVYQAMGQLDKALPLLEMVLEKMRLKMGPDHPDTLDSMIRLALAYDDASQFAKAETLYRDNLEKQRAKLCPNQRNIAMAQTLLGNNLLLQKKSADAEPLLRQAVDSSVQYVPHLWTTFWAKSLLGGALLGQKRYGDAEKLLLDGFAGMKQRADEMPLATRFRLSEAAGRLVQLYEAWQRPDDAAHWRKQLEALKQANAPGP
jgi:tetratricopeptide (TPR) repeat protein